MTKESDAGQDYRGAIERELTARLSEEPRNPLPGVTLLCLKCRGISDGDAHFCTHCGTQFNVLVVAARPKG